MNMEEAKTWPSRARERLEKAPAHKQVVLIYTGLTLGLSALVTLVVYLLDHWISQTSGLGSMGNRAMLSTLQTILPWGLNLFLLCLELGFVAAMLRISRGQYVSPQTLRLGFDRFWVLLRSTLLQAAMYLAVCLPIGYLAIAVYMATPWSDSLVDVVIAMMNEGADLSGAMTDQLLAAMEPCMIFCGIFMAIACLVLSYRFRMVNYILIDKPRIGAFAALRQSRAMMKGNCNALFKLDLRLWWYYAVTILAMVANYLDQILPHVFPSEALGYWVSYGLYLLILAGSYYFLRSRVEITYCFAYEALKPKEPKTQGVVLGNIFQM